MIFGGVVCALSNIFIFCERVLIVGYATCASWYDEADSKLSEYRPMRDLANALWFFVTRGTINGVLLGALAGTLTYPAAGTVIGLFYGGGVGFVLGIILAIATAIYNRRVTSPDMDWQKYQNNLTFWAGLSAALLTALPLFLIYAPVAALAAAYTAHQYADRYAGSVVKRKNEDRPLRRFEIKRFTVSRYIGLMLRKARPLLAIGWLLGVVALVTGAITSGMPFLVLLGFLSAFTMAVPLLGTLYVGLLGLVVGSVLHMLNRVYFHEDMPEERYQRQVMAIAAGVMLLTSPVVTLAFGAPIAAVVAALAARDFAGWYYDDEEKPKRHLEEEDAATLDRLLKTPQRESVWDDAYDEEQHENEQRR